MRCPFDADSITMWAVHTFIFAMSISTAQRRMWKADASRWDGGDGFVFATGLELRCALSIRRIAQLHSQWAGCVARQCIRLRKALKQYTMISKTRGIRVESDLHRLE
jgi:hypothetical protein